jgi:hypothetical protein
VDKAGTPGRSAASFVRGIARPATPGAPKARDWTRFRAARSWRSPARRRSSWTKFAQEPRALRNSVLRAPDAPREQPPATSSYKICFSSRGDAGGPVSGVWLPFLAHRGCSFRPLPAASASQEAGAAVSPPSTGIYGRWAAGGPGGAQGLLLRLFLPLARYSAFHPMDYPALKVLGQGNHAHRKKARNKGLITWGGDRRGIDCGRSTKALAVSLPSPARYLITSLSPQRSPGRATIS